MIQRFSWSSGHAAQGVVLVAATMASALTAGPGALAAQDGLEASCQLMGEGDRAECMLALHATRTLQARAGVALWGGSAVPGTASTLGMRIGSMPRLSFSGRLSMVPMTIPPLLDRTTDQGRRHQLVGLSGQGTVGLLPGWSPAPTVGGVLSTDLIARASVAPLPAAAGFRESAVLGWSAGVRVGALRESFTLPGVSLTTSYGRSTTVTLGDPFGDTTDGYARGSISNLSADLAASRRIAAFRVTGGGAVDRYRTRASVGHRTLDGATRVDSQGMVTTVRRSGYLSLAWTALIFHTSAEVGWQERPAPAGLPDGVALTAPAWWAGLAFRVSI